MTISTNSNRRLVLKHSRPLLLFALAGLLPTAIGAVAIPAALATGAAPADLALPLQGLALLGAGIALVFVAAAALTMLVERIAIGRLRGGASWARWPQYSSHEEWQRFVEAERASALRLERFPWPSLVLLAVIGVGIGWFTTAYLKAPPALLLTIGGMVGLLIGLVGLLHLGARLSSRARYQARRRSSPPEVLIGKWGLYHGV